MTVVDYRIATSRPCKVCGEQHSRRNKKTGYFDSYCRSCASSYTKLYKTAGGSIERVFILLKKVARS